MQDFFERIMAFMILIILSPLIVIIMAMIAIFLGRPVFFCQQRVGLNEKIFSMIKFRTMTEQKNQQGELLPDSERMTKFGLFLRSTSLDELPELWNVVKGDMSFVGPRPLLVEYLPLYTKEQRRRHEVKPGITGWAQINGRNNLDWTKRFLLDIWYVDNRTLWLDIKIMFSTFFIVLSRKNVSEKGAVTMTKFNGEA